MDRWLSEAKTAIVNYKLDSCCWLLPVRLGCLVTACFNIIADFVCIVGVANEGFSPTITKVEEALIEDNVTKPPSLLAYTAELAMNVLLICAIYRRDLKLMRVFVYYTIMAVVMSFLLYSIVIAAVPLELEVAIVFSTLFQVYSIILVRSLMVEIKMEDCKYELPTLVTMSSLVQEKEPTTASDAKSNQEDKKPEEKSQDVKVNIVERSTPDTKTKVEVNKGDVKLNIVSKTTDVSIKEQGKTQVVTKEKDKIVKEEKKDEKTLKEDKKDDQTPKDDKKKGDEKKEVTKDKKPKEVKTVQSIFRRHKKEVKNVSDKSKTDTSGTDQKVDPKDKLATVNEHPKV